MSKPGLLQIRPFPQWDEDPLNAAFEVHCFFEVADPGLYLVGNGNRITPPARSARARTWAS